MARSDPSGEFEYLRLFFPADREEIAIQLAKMVVRHLGEPAALIQPTDSLEELLNWPRREPSELVRFLIALEEEGICPKESLTEVETFRELVDYVAERTRTPTDRGHSDA